MKELKDYITEYVSSGRRTRHQYKKEIVAGKTTIPQLRSFLEANGFEETKTESTSVRNYMIVRFPNHTYIDIVKPEENYRFHVSFGEPKVSGKLTLNEVFKITDGNPLSTVSTIDELCEYVES